MKKETPRDRQRAEFDAMTELAKQWSRLMLTPIVDDDYPEVRHDFESALQTFLDKAYLNRPNQFRQLMFSQTLQPSPLNLTFDDLREANVKRIPQFRNAHGMPAHAKADGSDWSRAEWFEALVGEIGEYANFSKKLRRGDIDLEHFMREARSEIADMMIYLDLLAYRLEIDLAVAVRAKFNEVSQRVHSDVFLP